MRYEGNIEGGSIYLRSIEPGDCGDSYVRWLNDPEVNRYLESRLSEQTLESTLDFVRDVLASEDSCLFAVIYRDTGEHIGNIKVGPVNFHYKNALIGYVIGEKKYWGRGIATEAIRLAARFCFDVLKLHKVSAGVIASNAGSARALSKAGFKLEGTLREEVVVDGEYTDILRYGLLKGELK